MKKRNIEEEIHNLDALVRDNEQIPTKVRNNILKQLEVVRKCAKPRRSNKGRNQNQNSGLLKPVIISEEMAKFAGWEKDELHSRVDVTKAICAYIKGDEKVGRASLQKPSNKKTILPDQVLKDLLRWDADSEEMVVSAASGSVDGFNAFTLIKIPNSGLKKPNYYNNSELKTVDGEDVAVIKKVVLLDNDDYGFVLDKEDANFNVGDHYIVHVPLTYPKVQTKISIHLTKPETDEEPAKKEPKPKPKKEKAPKKEAKAESKAAEAKAEKKPKKSKKVKEPEPSSDEE
jgi:chromatin remodeling complex protein RSC6